MVTRRRPRYALRSNTLAIDRNGRTLKRHPADAAGLRSCLETDSGIRLPESPERTGAAGRIGRIPPEDDDRP